MQPAALPAGARVGPYRLSRLVAETPAAQVYLATDDRGRQRALKLAVGAASIDRRFRHEVDLLARIDHPNVVDLIDHGTDDGGRPYLVTDWIEGSTLRQRIGGDRLCPEAALLLLLDTSGAVGALHAAGLVHRDLKPENLMLTSTGRLVLIDLGVAFARDHTRYTEEGAIVGSVPYMSPEQIEGRDPSPASDVWSLGVIAYEWIAGARPFARDRQSAEVAAILAGRFAPLGEVDRRVSPALSELIGRCLALDPAARPRDAGALAAAVAPELDWLAGRDLAGERAALAIDPTGYADRVAPRRVDLAVRDAEAALAAGDPFAASRAVDRGLAYAPAEPRLTALVDRVVTTAPEPAATSPTERRRSRRLLPIALLVAALAAGTAITAVVASSSGGSAAPAAPVEPVAELPAAPPPAADLRPDDATPVVRPASPLPATPAPPPTSAPPPNQAYDELPPGMPTNQGRMIFVTP
jgi:serine/threonine-protein kinase